MLVEDPRFFVAPYVGKHGWIGIRIEEVAWPMVVRLILQSYRLIAPKTLARQLDETPSPKATERRHKA